MPSIAEFLMGTFRRTKPSPTTTVGSMGTAILGGYVQSFEEHADLQGVTKFKTYSEVLANTSIAAASVRFYLNLISKAVWSMELPKGEEENPEAQRLADLALEIIHGMETPWRRVVRRASMYRFYGYSVQEWTAMVREDGVLGLEDVAPRAQVTIERWDVNLKGQVRGMIQRSPQTMEEIYLPRSKTMYLVDDSLNDSPEGLGLFRNIVEPARRLTRYEQLEGYGFEGDLRGIPVGRAPYAELQQAVLDGDISETQKSAILKPLEDFIENHVKNPQLGIILDSLPYTTTDDAEKPSTTQQWALDLLKSGNTSLEPMHTAITRLNREIARTMGTEALLLGEGSAGSFALSDDKTTNFGLVLDDTLMEITAQVKRDILGPLWLLNGWDKKLMPTPKAGGIQQRDVEKVATTLKAIHDAAMNQEDPAINQLRDRLGLEHALPEPKPEPPKIVAPGEPPTTEDGEDDSPST